MLLEGKVQLQFAFSFEKISEYFFSDISDLKIILIFEKKNLSFEVYVFN
jgi:hypothetical protein